jgi:hypothetical protein
LPLTQTPQLRPEYFFLAIKNSDGSLGGGNERRKVDVVKKSAVKASAINLRHVPAAVFQTV